MRTKEKLTFALGRGRGIGGLGAGTSGTLSCVRGKPGAETYNIEREYTSHNIKENINQQMAWTVLHSHQSE